jgi:hypothetical protein
VVPPLFVELPPPLLELPPLVFELPEFMFEELPPELVLLVLVYACFFAYLF